MIKRFFTIAFRRIRQDAILSSINIVGLALGIASCLVITLYVWNETHYDTFNKNFENIYRVVEKQDQSGQWYNVAVTPGPLAPVLQSSFPEIVNVTRFGKWSGLLKHASSTIEVKNIQLTDHSIFDMFDFQMMKGDVSNALMQANEIVLTESVATKFFGSDWMKNDHIIGQTITLNKETVFTVVGVVQDPPANSSIQFDALLPLSYLFASDKWSNKWNSNNYHTYVQLKPQTNAVTFQGKIKSLLAKQIDGSKDELQLQPLQDQYLKSTFDFHTDWGKRSSITYIQILIGVAILLLIIACFNFVNLSTARFLKRSMEVGVRKVSGASRTQLALQFLSESFLLSLIAGGVAVMIIVLAMPWIEAITGSPFNDVLTKPVFLTLFVGFIMLISTVAGIYPALSLASVKPGLVLKKADATASGRSIRKGLVVAQFTISLSLIICTIFMYRQFQFIRQQDLGFDKEQLINVRLGGQLGGASVAFKNDIATIPGVLSAAPATISMANVDNSSNMTWDGMQESDKFLVTQANVDPDFIPSLKMELVSGKNFSAQRTNDTSTYILNESAVKRMGFDNNSVLGKQIGFWGAKGRAIGVVKDFNFKPLRTGVEPFIFRYQPQDRYFNMFVKIQPGQTQSVLAQLAKKYKQYEADVPFQYSFVNEDIEAAYKGDRQIVTVLALFAALTILISCLGLFGLSVFSVERRVKEIGIRKVLGATLLSITRLLASDFLKLVLVAVIISTPIAWYAVSKWLQQYAYRTDVSWWIFGLAGVTVLFVAFATVSVQSIRTAAANPVKSLRTE
jgi:putative ABC transport system permease protein